MDMDEFRSLLRTEAGGGSLTVREVYEDQGFATNVENAYPFDLRHCIKVELLV